jgi:drug/metabolite transporter (DMT)-like permease
MREQATIGRRLTVLGYGACALAGTLWGTGFYFGRLALNEMSVEHMVLYRFLFASLGMLPVALVNRVRLSPGEMRTLLLAAVFGIPIQFLIQFKGLDMTTVSHASLMVGAMPVLLAAAAALFAGESLDWFGWLALCGSTVGVALVVLGGRHAAATRGQPTLAGDMLVICSDITALAWILLSKKVMKTHSPLVVSAYTILSGSLMLIVIVLGRQMLSPFTHEQVAPMPFGRVSATAGYHHVPLELGHSSRAGLPRGGFFEHRTRIGLSAGRRAAGRTAGSLRVAGRRAHCGRGRCSHHPRPRDWAGSDSGVAGGV